jgi:N-acetylglutamate synthase-like GNAT family acetyltransferase
MDSTSAASRSGVGFTEKGFYLGEFRGRTLALAARGPELGRRDAFEPVLKDLEANPTDVVLISSGSEALRALGGAPLLTAASESLEGAVWRGLQKSPRVGVVIDDAASFAAECRRVALALGVAKLVWIEGEGGLVDPQGGSRSFVDLEELGGLLHATPAAVGGEREQTLREIEKALRGGLASVNLCTPEGVADELFTYAGSGTLFTRERYVAVRRLALDDLSAAHDLIQRGIAEGYLAVRSASELDRIFANGYGAFVEGRLLAGVSALLPLAGSDCAEIASLYTLTRFLGEGVGGHLVDEMCERARADGLAFVFACTTTERVVRFFERTGFRQVPPGAIPEEKWRDYDASRLPQVRCLRRDLR